MPIVFNLSGIVISVAALVAAAGVYTLVNSLGPQREAVEQAAFLFGFALVAVGLDVLYRKRRNREDGKARFYSPLKGGSLMFLPLWLYGALAVPGGAYHLVTCPESTQEVLDRYRPAAEGKVAKLKTAYALFAAGGHDPRPVSPSDLKVKPFVNRPVSQANVAFYRPYGSLASDTDVNGNEYESVFYLPSWFGIDEPGGKSSLPNVRSCAVNLAGGIEEALAIRYLVARRPDDEQFFVIDIDSERILGSFRSKADEESVRAALSEATGGTFVFR